MKRVFLTIAILSMATLIAAPAIAEGPGGGGECEKGEFQRRGPGQGRGGPGEGFRHPGGPEGGRGGPGQGRGGPGRFIEKMLDGDMAEELGLEAEQIKQLKKGMTRLHKQEEGLQQKLQAAAKEQAELLSAKGEIDEAALMKAIEKTGKIRTQMAKLRMQPVLLVKKTLTPEQLQKSRKLMHQRMQKQREEWQKRRGEGDRPRGDGEWEERRKRRKDKAGRKKKAGEEADGDE
jgi:Spy/CpxP family protein refolding chaperone